MVITAEERRRTLALFNISEAARRLGIPVQIMHRAIRGGKLPEPEIKLGKRLYYTSDDLVLLTNRLCQLENLSRATTDNR